MLTGSKHAEIARNQFHTTVPLIWERGSRKRLVLVTSGLLGQFVKALTADCRILVRIGQFVNTLTAD